MKYLLIACVAAAAALALSGAAIPAHSKSSATTYTVFLGDQGPPPAAIRKLKLFGAINQFMPSKLVIAAGDSVTFSSGFFHTVTYAPKPFALFLPDPAKGTYAGLNDAAGEPFYFDTLGKFIYNPPAFAPFGPKTISGKTPVSSGALSPQGPKSPPATATYSFPTAGTYKLFCTVHPGMTGTVVVKPAGSAVSKTPDQVKAQALLQMGAAYEKEKALAASTKPAGANTVVMGVGGKVSLFAFYPKVMKVKAGTTVRFVNRAPSEVHNIVFGPKKYLEQWGKKTDLMPQGPNAPNQVTPILPYGTDPKPMQYAGAATHGNGFFATPLTAGAPIGLPRSSNVTFTTPGTYKYFCWIHGPDMGGTIVVTP
jgi:plastocyanin